MSRKYVILDAADVPSVTGWGGETVLESSADTLRWNFDKTKTFVKYVGNKPRFLHGKDVLTNAEMRKELKKEEWSVSQWMRDNGISQ